MLYQLSQSIILAIGLANSVKCAAVKPENLSEIDQARLNTLIEAIKDAPDAASLALIKEGGPNLNLDDTGPDYGPIETPISGYIYAVNDPKLDNGEVKFMETRVPKAMDALINFLYKAGLNNLALDSSKMSAFDMPRIGIAISGGGLRAHLNGAGFIKALDARTGSKSALSGLLQSSLYISGLSGGSWLLGSLISNDFKEIDELTKENFHLSTDFTNANPADPSYHGPWYYWQVMNQVGAKSAKYFAITIGDYWGRMIQNFVKPTPIGQTISSIAQSDWFVNGDFPFPIVLANYRHKDDAVKDADYPTIELTPLEFKSKDPRISASFPMKYIGTATENGRSKSDQSAYVNFDNLGFCLGTSANVFPLINPTSVLPWYLRPVYYFLSFKFTKPIDVAHWPNPFKGASNDSIVKDLDDLHLLDGGFNFQNIPVTPLLDKERKLDVILMSDSAPFDEFPTGEELWMSYDYYTSKVNASQYGINTLPQIPTVDYFAKNNLTQRNVIFGVDADIESPVVVWFPNRKVSFDSNVPLLKLAFSDSDRDGMIQNFFDITSNQEQLGEEWSLCVACAVTERYRQRNSIKRPNACITCFQKYGP